MFSGVGGTGKKISGTNAAVMAEFFGDDNDDDDVPILPSISPEVQGVDASTLVSGKKPSPTSSSSIATAKTPPPTASGSSAFSASYVPYGRSTGVASVFGAPPVKASWVSRGGKAAYMATLAAAAAKKASASSSATSTTVSVSTTSPTSVSSSSVAVAAPVPTAVSPPSVPRDVPDHATSPSSAPHPPPPSAVSPQSAPRSVTPPGTDPNPSAADHTGTNGHTVAVTPTAVADAATANDVVVDVVVEPTSLPVHADGDAGSTTVAVDDAVNDAVVADGGELASESDDTGLQSPSAAASGVTDAATAVLSTETIPSDSVPPSWEATEDGGGAVGDASGDVAVEFTSHVPDVAHSDGGGDGSGSGDDANV